MSKYRSRSICILSLLMGLICSSHAVAQDLASETQEKELISNAGEEASPSDHTPFEGDAASLSTSNVESSNSENPLAQEAIPQALLKDEKTSGDEESSAEPSNADRPVLDEPAADPVVPDTKEATNPASVEGPAQTAHSTLTHEE